MLSAAQKAKFESDGWLLVEEAVTAAQLSALRAQLALWIEESRSHGGAYGELMDGRPRFDLAPEHSRDHPQLRRVNNPSEVSEAFEDAYPWGRHLG